MRSADVVNLCLGHDQALAGLYRGVTEFSQALNAPILSVEPAERAYDPCEGEVCRLEATGSLALVSSHYMNKAASVAAASFLNDTRLLIVHSLFRGHVGFAMRWAAESRRHYWAVPHGCLDPWGMAYHGIQKRLWMAAIGNRYLAHARRVIFSSKREAEKAAAWTRGAKSAVVHFPVRFPDLSRRDAARHQLRVKLGISEDARILLYAGRLHSMKRPRALLHAFLRAEAANLVLVVVGGDDDVTRGELEKSLPPSAAGRVYFTGMISGPEVMSSMLAADGFISLSYRENFGFSLAEACAAGLPIIATSGHDLMHEMQTGQGAAGNVGWLLPDLSEATAVQAIEAFAAASEWQLRSIGQNARQWATDNLSEQVFREQVTAMLP